MNKIVSNFDFKSVRKAYVEVKTFIEKEIYCKNIKLSTKIDQDLGCAGDDNLDLINKFVLKYNLNYGDFDYSKHFYSEQELFGSGAALITILTLPFLLISFMIKVITFNRIDFNKISFFKNNKIEKLDLTFGDMLTWYLEGKYMLRKNCRFQKSIN